ncbi:MAG TPA: hypothetical protein PKU97_21705 [Kofleriaceae bacterium]|nr:hypothetical protein [Kofleriaceae bacterium]
MEKYFERRDEKNAKLHLAVEEIERQLASWPAPGAGSDAAAPDAALGALRLSWSALLSVMDLQATPLVAECPHCHATGMREATVCGTCWQKLTPPAAEPTKAAAEPTKAAAEPTKAAAATAG